MATSEPTIQDVLDAMQVFSHNVDDQLTELRTDVSILKTDVSALKTDMTSVKGQMVTKSYLDDKIGDLRGELVVLARKSNKKFEALVDELHAKGSITTADAGRLLAMEPFAR